MTVSSACPSWPTPTAPWQHDRVSYEPPRRHTRSKPCMSTFTKMRFASVSLGCCWPWGTLRRQPAFLEFSSFDHGITPGVDGTFEILDSVAGLLPRGYCSDALPVTNSASLSMPTSTSIFDGRTHDFPALVSTLAIHGLRGSSDDSSGVRLFIRAHRPQKSTQCRIGTWANFSGQIMSCESQSNLNSVYARQNVRWFSVS